MRRLRRAMHDQVETLRSKQFFDQGTVANIHRGVREALCRALKPLQVPQRVSCGPEEYAAHVVIHAVEHFDRQGHEVTGVDNNMRCVFLGPTGDTLWNLERLKRTTKRFTLASVNIRNRALI